MAHQFDTFSSSGCTCIRPVILSAKTNKSASELILIYITIGEEFLLKGNKVLKK